MAKLEQNTDPSIPQRRRQIPRYAACETCRTRKKRCNHVDIFLDTTFLEKGTKRQKMVESAVSVSPSRHSNNSLQDDIFPQSRPTDSSQPPLQTSFHIQDDNGDVPLEEQEQVFAGGSNPEAIFHAAMSQMRGQYSGREDLGIWMMNDKTIPSSPRNFSQPNRDRKISTRHHSMPMLVRAVLPYVEAECLAVLPSSETCNALIDIYMRKIHPIMPIFDESLLERIHGNDPEIVILKQALCLAASKDPSAKSFLLLPGGSSCVAHRAFADTLFSVLKVSLDIGLVNDKLILIQVLLLLTFHSYGPDGNNETARFCAQAVHYLFSAGLHVTRRQSRGNEDFLETLFCCVWSTEKHVAALCGRPYLMHQYDIGLDLQKCFQKQSPGFRLHLKITEILETVLGLYRPSTANQHSTPQIDNLPEFEDLVEECKAENLAPELLATTEVLYNVTTVMSCPARHEPPEIRSKLPVARRSLAAARITALVGDEFHHRLTMINAIPYAVSLSLSICYSALRNSKLSTNRNRARKDFEANCKLLKELSEQFWMAEAMAKLGFKALSEIDRITTESMMMQPQETGKEFQYTNDRYFPTPTVESPQQELSARSFSDSQNSSYDLGNSYGQERLSQYQELPSQYSQIPTLNSHHMGGPYPNAASPVSLNNLVQTSLWTNDIASLNLEGMDMVFGNNLDPTMPGGFIDLAFALQS